MSNEKMEESTMSMKNAFDFLTSSKIACREKNDDWATRRERVIIGTVMHTARGNIHLQAGRLMTARRREELKRMVQGYDFSGAAKY